MSTTLSARDRRIPLYFVAFFLVIALVDGVMVTLAVRTRTGVVTDHPYEKGLAYNEVVQAEQAQEKLHWDAHIDFRPDRKGSLKGTLGFQLKDKDNIKLTPEILRADFVRPTQEGMDFSVPMQSAEQTINFPAHGLWDVRIYARIKGIDYQQAKRIVVP